MRKVFRLMGSGGNGYVYEIKCGKNYIVKFYENVELSQREYENLLRLKRIDGIPLIRENCSINSQCGANVIRKIRGQDLLQYAQNGSNLCIKEIKQIIYQLLCIINKVHSRGMCHRDIKLENVMVTYRTKKVYLIDWDYGIECENRNTLVQRCGSLLYASPEILTGIPYNGFKTDIWSFGVVVFTLIFLKHPFDGKYHISDMRVFSGKNYTKDMMLAHFLDVTMAYNPSKRWLPSSLLEHPWFCS